VSRQLRLPLQSPPLRSRADFVVSAANAAALRQLDAWPAWHGGVLALVGPEGSGKSHLADDWAHRAGARRFAHGEPQRNSAPGATLIEDADRALSDDELFHLINAAGADDVTLLLTSRLRPLQWPFRLPDLRSRLAAMPVTELHPPDDPVLAAVMLKLFRERGIEPPVDVIEYLLRRIERSVPAAQRVVALLDEEGAAQQRDINRSFARQVLENHPLSLNLFDP
jgi:chromosomal replication initiation ATPase DnaA